MDVNRCITIPGILKTIDSLLKEKLTKVIIISDYEENYCEIEFAKDKTSYRILTDNNKKRYDKIYKAIKNKYEGRIELKTIDNLLYMEIAIDESVIIIFDYTSKDGRKWITDLIRKNKK